MALLAPGDPLATFDQAAFFDFLSSDCVLSLEIWVQTRLQVPPSWKQPQILGSICGQYFNALRTAQFSFCSSACQSIYNIFEKKINRCVSYQGSKLPTFFTICRIFVSLEFGSSSDLGLELGAAIPWVTAGAYATICHILFESLWFLSIYFFGSDFSGSGRGHSLNLFDFFLYISLDLTSQVVAGVQWVQALRTDACEF